MTETTESICEWRESPVFPDEYMVSSDGRVFSKRKNKLLKPNTDKYGYLYYVLCVCGERKTVKAHRLVGNAFIENNGNRPTINHKNGDRKDNRVENLEWATWKEQKNDPLTKSNMESVYALTDYRKMGEIRNFGRTPVVVMWSNGKEQFFGSLLEASKETGKNYSHLSEIARGKRSQPKEFCIAVTKKHFPEGEDDA